MHRNRIMFHRPMIQAGIHDVCFNIKNALCTETKNANPHGQSKNVKGTCGARPATSRRMQARR